MCGGIGRGGGGATTRRRPAGGWRLRRSGGPQRRQRAGARRPLRRHVLGEGGAQRRRHARPRVNLHRLGVEAAEASLGRLDRRGVRGGEVGAAAPAQKGRRPRGGVGQHAQPGRRAGVHEAGAECVRRRRHDRHRRR